jgi:hypothetical protein
MSRRRAATPQKLSAILFIRAEALQKREMVRDAVLCHFEDDNRPKIIRLHFVREEVIAA